MSKLKPADAALRRLVVRLIKDAKDARAVAVGQAPAYWAWLSRVDALLASLGARGQPFRERSKIAQDPTTYARRLLDAERTNARFAAGHGNEWIVDNLTGVLDGLAESIRDGLLVDIEDRISSEVYGGVLAEARVLLDAGHLDCAAILLRVGLEDGLRRRARRDSMPNVDKEKSTVVNAWLWKQGVYPKMTHDSVEGWLALGNAFAHSLPEKAQYTSRDVAKALADVAGFLGAVLA